MPKANLSDYTTDIIGFLEDYFIVPEKKRRIELEWWQKEYILKPLFYDLDEDGKRKYNIAVIGMPKKNGKSTLGAAIGVFFMYCDEPAGEIIIAANDKDQASQIIYSKIVRSINKNPALKRGVKPLKGSIEIASTGTTCRCLAHQTESAAGLNPNLTEFDEIWGFKDREFYDELTVVPTRENPLIVIVTYAGYVKSGILWELYKDGMAGDDIIDIPDREIVVKRGKKDESMFFFWSNENLASWITPKYLAKQRDRLPDNVYQRLHENRWSAIESSLFTDDDINKLHGIPWVKQTKASYNPNHIYTVSTDLGLRHDRAARAVGHLDRESNRIFVDNLRVWQGSQSHPVDIAEVERDLVDVSAAFHCNRLIVDPWQMEYVMQRLRGFYTAIPFNFQTEMVYLSQVLINLIRADQLICYDEPLLDAELIAAESRQTTKGWKIDHAAGGYSDCIVSVGMMALELAKLALGASFYERVATNADERPSTHFAGIREKVF